MSSFIKNNKSYLVTGIAVLAVAVLLVGAAPLLIQAAPVAESVADDSASSPQKALPFDPEPSTETITVDNVADKNAFRPGDMPRYGIPHLFISEVVVSPDKANKINFTDTPWIHSAMDNRGNFIASQRAPVDIGKVAGIGKTLDENAVNIGQVVSLDSDKQESFFAFYDQAETGSPFFEVTFPDGSVKYFVIRYVEVQ